MTKEHFHLQPHVRGLPRVLGMGTGELGMGSCAGWNPVWHLNPWAAIHFSMYKQTNIALTPTFTCRNRKNPSHQAEEWFSSTACGYRTSFLLFNGALRMPQMKWACFDPAAFSVVWTFPLFASFPQNHFHLIWITFWPHSLKDERNCLHCYNQGKVHYSEKMGDSTLQYYPGSWWCINVV